MTTTLVIGASSGIGKATSDRLAKRIHNGPATFPPGNRILTPPKSMLDVTHPSEISDYVDRNSRGDLEYLVYSAGINILDMVPDIEMDDFEEIMQINVMGFVRLVGEIIRSGEPLRSVVVVSSDAAVRPMRGSTMYCASKAALNAAVGCMARELAPKVRVNAVSPGMTDGTEMTKYIDSKVPAFRGWTPEQARNYERSQIPMGRRATVDEVAEVIESVLYGPDYLTGAIIPVNGGR